MGAFSKKQLGGKSRFGASKLKRTLVPWGRNKAMNTKSPKAVAHNNSRATPDPQLFSMDYPVNKPSYWPIEDGKRKSPTAPTQALADKHNAIVNQSFERDGYAG